MECMIFMTNAVPANVLKNNEKLAAKKLIQKSARDYLTLKLTLPLGNTALKKVHTNQWLFTELPKEFPLKNWEVIANALNSNLTRNAGYVLNRWYIEGIQTTVDMNGKAEMQLSLNAFASDTSKYVEGMQSFSKAYSDATKNTSNSSSNKNSSAKSKSNATKKNNTKLFPTKAGKNVGGNLKTAAKKITKDCNTMEQKAYCIYDWVDKYVQYRFYYDSERTSSQILQGAKANCWDTAHLIYNLCCKVGVHCKIMNGTYHFLGGTYGHTWNQLPYKGKMVFADTGRNNRNKIGSHGGSGHYIISQSLLKKNY